MLCNYMLQGPNLVSCIYQTHIEQNIFDISCVCYLISNMANKQRRRHVNKTFSFHVAVAFLLNTKKEKEIYLFIFLFVSQSDGLDLNGILTSNIFQ